MYNNDLQKKYHDTHTCNQILGNFSKCIPFSYRKHNKEYSAIIMYIIYNILLSR